MIGQSTSCAVCGCDHRAIVIKSATSPLVYLAGDIPTSHVFEEEEAILVCANWGQVRTYLHKQRLNRGFVKQKPLPGNKRKGKGGKGKGMDQGINGGVEKKFGKF